MKFLVALDPLKSGDVLNYFSEVNFLLWSAHFQISNKFLKWLETQELTDIIYEGQDMSVSRN